MKRILLYSGGLDSLCAKAILEQKFNYQIDNVFFQIGTPYEKDELLMVDKYNEQFAMSDSYLAKFPTIKTFSLPALNNSGLKTSHIPVRNALLILETVALYLTKYGIDEELEIYVPQILEIGRDKNSKFFGLLSKMLNHSYGYNVKIKRPFRYLTKGQLLLKAHEVWSFIDCKWIDKFSYSCYMGGPECGACGGCIPKQQAYYEIGWRDEPLAQSTKQKLQWRTALGNWKAMSLRDVPQMLKILWYELRKKK